MNYLSETQYHTSKVKAKGVVIRSDEKACEKSVILFFYSVESEINLSRLPTDINVKWYFSCFASEYPN